MTFASNSALLVAGRLFVGIGSGNTITPWVLVWAVQDIMKCQSECTSGATTVLVPMYLADISPSSLRGAIGTLNQLAITSVSIFS